MKECKKAEKVEAKGRGSKPGTEPWAIRVRFLVFPSLFTISSLFCRILNLHIIFSCMTGC